MSHSQSEQTVMFIESQLLKEVEDRDKLNKSILNDALYGLDSHPDTIADVLYDVLSYYDSQVRSRTLEQVREHVKSLDKSKD